MSEGPSLQARFRRRLEEAPDGFALTEIASDRSFRWLSYAELWERGLDHASVLADRGLSEGDTAVLALPSDLHAAVTLLGVLQLGARPLMVAPPVVRGLHSNLRDVLRFVARRTRARVVAVDDEHGDMADELFARSRTTQAVVGTEPFASGDGSAVKLGEPSADDHAAYQLTSGTTGFPRICMWPQHRVLKALDGMGLAMGLAADDVCLNWTPLYHDMGLVNNFLLCLSHRVPLAMLDTMDFVKRPARWLQGLSDTGATVTWSPNFGFALSAQRVRDRQMEGVRLDHVKAMWNAAEKIHAETLAEFQERFAPFGLSRTALKTNFGCAENVGGATFSAVDDTYCVEHVDGRRLAEGVAEVVSAEHEGAVPVVSAGRPCPGLRISIVSPQLRELPDGMVGQVAMDTPSRLDGFLGDARETAKTLKGGVVRTGDVGYVRDGELFWTGRYKERINLHGKKYDPSDFESVLLEVEGLREGCFAAFGVDDPAVGTQRLVIVSEVRRETDRDPDEILREVQEVLVRRAGVTADDLILLPTGSMTKTSSGKRRHRYYGELYRQGALEPVARLKRS